MTESKKKEQPIIINNVIGGQPQQYAPSPVSADTQKRKTNSKHVLILAAVLGAILTLTGANLFGMEDLTNTSPYPAMSEFLATTFWMLIPSYILVGIVELSTVGVKKLLKK